ncbi:MAG: amino acid permease, partial [Deltaproteobacteria bacterium]|nr:amino acid permease [Deltaproteobacteria bacterium]
MKKKGQGVEYVRVADHYFEKRGLRRYAGVWSLWALGVGAVISGDFFGWNFGLAAGGFGGLLIATLIITVMYAGLCFSIAEMSAALPHTGGAYSFARSAMGPWGAYITGLAENMEYILTPAVIVVGIGGYLGAIFETPAFWVTAIPHFDMEWALNIEPEPGQSRWLPRGPSGILSALPFAIWFFLAIEQLPLAGEEAHTPARDLPRGLLYGLLTLIVAAFLTLFLNAGIAPGSQALGSSAEPLFEGFKTIFGAGLGAKALALVAVTGLIASFHSIIFAYGRQIF